LRRVLPRRCDRTADGQERSASSRRPALPRRRLPETDAVAGTGAGAGPLLRRRRMAQPRHHRDPHGVGGSGRRPCRELPLSREHAPVQRSHDPRLSGGQCPAPLRARPVSPRLSRDRLGLLRPGLPRPGLPRPGLLRPGPPRPSRAVQPMTRPLSTMRFCPVTAREAGEAKKTTADATSSGVVTRRRALASAIWSKTSSGVADEASVVRSRPPETMFTLTPAGPRSLANVLVSDSRAALAAV